MNKTAFKSLLVLLCVFYSCWSFAKQLDCSKAKTPDDCALCCGQLIGSSDRPGPLVQGCSAVSQAPDTSTRLKAAAQLEGQTGISSVSIEAICNHDHAEIKNGFDEQDKNNFPNVVTDAVRDCTNHCPKPKKTKGTK